MTKMGRPQAPINKRLLETLAAYGLTRKDIVNVLSTDLGLHTDYKGCTDDTVDRFVKREYGVTFSEFLIKRKSILKSQLLNKAFAMVGKNAAVTIFFLKNVLGWTDKIEQTQNINGAVPTVQVYLPDNKRDKRGDA